MLNNRAVLTSEQIRKASLTTMAGFFFFAGIIHFIRPQMYLPIVPPILPFPLALIYLSGAAESGLGLALLHPKLRRLAAWGIIALLIAVFPANVRMLQLADTVYSNDPRWLLVARLPFQLVFIAWAYSHTSHRRYRR